MSASPRIIWTWVECQKPARRKTFHMKSVARETVKNSSQTRLIDPRRCHCSDTDKAGCLNVSEAAGERDAWDESRGEETKIC